MSEKTFCAIPVDYIDGELEVLLSENKAVFDKYNMLILAKQTNVKMAETPAEIEVEPEVNETEQGAE